MATSRTTEGGSKRGFGAMDKELQRQISRKGGESVPPEQRSFSKNPELAREAGRKGGEHSRGGGRGSSSGSGSGSSNSSGSGGMGGSGPQNQ